MNAKNLIWIAGFTAFLSTSLWAAPKDVDLTGPNPNPKHTFQLQMGSPFSDNFGVSNATGNVFWEFFSTPFGATSSDGFQANFSIHGVTITLPAGSPGTAVSNAATVSISGTPTTSGSFSFTVTVSDGTNTRNREYELLIDRPLDLVMVFDRSGSMSTNTGAGVTRWQALRSAASNFANIYQALNRTNDRFSITYFESDLVPTSACCAGMTAVTNTIGTSISNDLNAQTPAGSTGMGAGLKDAQGKLADASRSRSILLFTDGEQNVPPPSVNNNGMGYSDGTSIPGGSSEGGIKIFTIGVGNPSGGYLTTLQNLASNNRGNCYITEDGSTFNFSGGKDMATAFLSNGLVNMLAEFSPQLIVQKDNVTSGAAPHNLAAFPLNKRVDKLLLQIAFDKNFEIPQLAQVLARISVQKNGVNVIAKAKPSWAGNYTNTILLTFDFVNPPSGSGPPISPEGDWTVALGDVANFKINSCRVSALADDHRLNYTFGHNPTAPLVNSTLKPSVTLDWLGYPITDATVEAIILRPGDDLGDLLANNPLHVDVSGSEDAGSPGSQKFDQLWATDQSFRDALQLQENVVPLAHTADGKYEGSFAGLNVAGIYQIVYRITGEKPETGKFQRLIMESFYTGFAGVDLALSAISSHIADGVLTLNITPTTPYGKKVGPAMGSVFTVDNPAVQITNVIDNQDGSYTLTFSGDLSQPVSLQLMGQEIYKGKITRIGKGDSIIDKVKGWLESLGLPEWTVWILLLLILLLLIWIIRKLVKK